MVLLRKGRSLIGPGEVALCGGRSTEKADIRGAADPATASSVSLSFQTHKIFGTQGVSAGASAAV